MICVVYKCVLCVCVFFVIKLYLTSSVLLIMDVTWLLYMNLYYLYLFFHQVFNFSGQFSNFIQNGLCPRGKSYGSHSHLHSRLHSLTVKTA